MRTLMRVLILWSKNRSLSDNRAICLTYSTGFLDFVQRMISITQSEQDCFDILSGIVRFFPRPFSVSESVLLGAGDSVMRYEMTAFKAMVQQNLPKIYKKLKSMGLALEMLVYYQIESFYATYFVSEIVLRLWDIIIFNFSSGDKDERKRGLWWLLAPAFFVLQESESDILEAKSCEEVIQVFSDGGSISYDTDMFFRRLKELIKKIFVEGDKVQKGLMSYVYKQLEVEN